MCGIYASFNSKKFEDLQVVNKKRGVVNQTKETLSVNKKKYYIGHIQSPTSNSANPHPAFNVEYSSMLWHNGIVKEQCLSEHLNIDFGGWDTMLILHLLNLYGFDALSDIDGSFACVYHKQGEVYIFRNEIAPLYVDKHLNLSSLKVDGMHLLPANKVFYIDHNYELVVAADFTTKNNPYKL